MLAFYNRSRVYLADSDHPGGKMMSPQSEQTLLTPTEREALKMISTGSVPHNQRAVALLAIDDGATQAQAAELAGLSRGQVKYWLAKYRQVRLEIFPQAETAAEREEQIVDTKARDKNEKPAKASKKGKKGKGKKGKKGKKPKGKKGKGQGKGKKSKKGKKKSR